MGSPVFGNLGFPGARMHVWCIDLYALLRWNSLAATCLKTPGGTVFSVTQVAGGCVPQRRVGDFRAGSCSLGGVWAHLQGSRDVMWRWGREHAAWAVATVAHSSAFISHWGECGRPRWMGKWVVVWMSLQHGGRGACGCYSTSGRPHSSHLGVQSLPA